MGATVWYSKPCSRGLRHGLEYQTVAPGTGQPQFFPFKLHKQR
jgi:hypothetical protein